MSQSEGIEMNTFSFVIFLFSFAISLTSAGEDFPENTTPTTYPPFSQSENNSAAKPADKPFTTPQQPPHNIRLSDNTGNYHIARDQPRELQAALGAISGHILNQRGHRGYVPYVGHRGQPGPYEEEDPVASFGGQRIGRGYLGGEAPYWERKGWRAL